MDEPVGFEFLVSLLICSSVAEVTQQSKARHKNDFVSAFSPIIADATATAWKGAPTDIREKLRKVVAVWRERSIFEPPLQAALESRISGKTAQAQIRIQTQPRAPPRSSLLGAGS